jgi:ABC-type phosphate transport system permease subunit
MDDRQEKGDTRMKGREARPGIAVAQAIGRAAAAAMLVAVVLGAGPRVAYSADATFTVGGKTITCTVSQIKTHIRSPQECCTGPGFMRLAAAGCRL